MEVLDTLRSCHRVLHCPFAILIEAEEPSRLLRLIGGYGQSGTVLVLVQSDLIKSSLLETEDLLIALLRSRGGRFRRVFCQKHILKIHKPEPCLTKANLVESSGGSVGNCRLFLYSRLPNFGGKTVVTGDFW
jgi:hypothetical protein